MNPLHWIMELHTKKVGGGGTSNIKRPTRFAETEHFAGTSRD